MPTRAPFFVALVLALGLVPFGLGATSCATDCTLAGCGNGLTIEFDETVPRDYTVTVTVDGKTATADCTAAVEPDTTAEFAGNLGALETSLSCRPDGLTFSFSPKSLNIVIAFPDGVTTTIDATPKYQEYYPNGEDCDEVPCLRATYEVDINPPTG